MAEALQMKVDTPNDENFESYNLPDVRDGLTPSQRRILWTMRKRKLSSHAQYEMTAKTVKDIAQNSHWMLKEADIMSDLIVQMTHHFNSVALIEAGRGNFGQYGGNATYPRFTEIRLHSFAENAMLKSINKKVVDYKDDDSITCGQVPTVFPARIPGALVLGTDVIADGFSSQIPPHNLGEVIDAMVAMIQNPKLAPERILDYIKGPDFITGGVIVNKSELPQIYSSGRGKIRVRGKATVEKSFENENMALVFTGIPPTMDRDFHAFETLIDRFVVQEQLPGVISAYQRWGSKVEWCIELKASANVPQILEYIYQNTPMEDIIDYQAILLSGNEPARMSLYSILSEHLAFYRDFLRKKNGVAPTAEEMCQELLAIKAKYAKPRKTEIIDL